MSFLQSMFDRLRPVATIYADDGNIVFHRGAEEVRSQSLIRIAEDGKISDIGQDAATATGGRLVRLFAPDAESDESAVRAFSRYHLMLTSGSSFVRRRVAIAEPTFRRTFGPAAAITLLKVLQADGFDAAMVDAT